MKKLLICLFATLFGFGSMYAQNAISGTIVSEKSRNFIEYASVYIDGTSKGTVTDSNGHFTLKNLNFPCRLVVSCVGYELQSFQFSTATIENLNIELKEQFKHLSEISVAGKNRRNPCRYAATLAEFCGKCRYFAATSPLLVADDLFDSCPIESRRARLG